MANVDRPNGFRPVKRNGGAYDGPLTMYLYENTTAAYVGDVVKLDGDAGDAGTVVNGINVEGMPTIARLTAATEIPVGVICGFLPLASNLNLPQAYKENNSTVRIALVCDDPEAFFEIQEDRSTTPVVPANMSAHYSFTTTAGSTSTGLSGMELISSTGVTTTANPLKMVALSPIVDNAFCTSSTADGPARFIVKFNSHAYGRALSAKSSGV